jgi:hypothetical protein
MTSYLNGGLESFGPMLVNTSKQVVNDTLEPDQRGRAQPSKKLVVDDQGLRLMDQDEHALNRKKACLSPK